MGEDWVEYSDRYWHNVINKNSFSKKQGWKIHITADISDAQELLYVVANHLIKNKISFKFVNSVQELVRKNGKQGDRSAVGKFITIYPQDEEIFCSLLVILKKLTSKFKKGPFILNDCCWQESNVFFRYGGFIRNEKIIDGKEVLVIEDNDGNYVEDERRPYYSLPEFVVEPEYVKKNNTFPDERNFQKIRELDIKEAIHFSNSGGVYRFENKGESYVLKEGRYKAGLDATGNDGIRRIKNEYYNLSILKNVKSVIDVYDYFEAWENNYFVESYFNGETLKNFVATNYPLLLEDGTEKYLKIVDRVATKLYQAIIEIHKNGVGIGDLSINNVMISVVDNDVKIKIIDLENAQGIHENYSPSLVTPGFFANNIYSVKDADLFSYTRIIRYMLLPINFVLDLSSLMIDVQNQIIMDKFGNSVEKILSSLENIEQHKIKSEYVLPYQINALKPVTEELCLANIDNYIERLAKNIYRTILERKHLSIHGDISDIGGWNDFNISNGVFGALLVINRVKKYNNIELSDKIDEAVQRIRLLDKNERKLGLLDGLAGIITALIELNYYEYAKEFLKVYTIDEIEKYKDDISFETGLAGIGIFLLGIYRKTKNDKIHQLCIKTQKIILKQLDTVLEKRNLDISLFKGIGGVLLFLVLCKNDLKLPQQKSSKIEDLITTIFESVESDIEEKYSYIVNKDKTKDRIIPYLKDGGAGVIFVLLMIYKKNSLSYRLMDRVQKLLGQMMEVIRLEFSFDAGLYEGQLIFSLLERCYCRSLKIEEKYIGKLLSNLKLHFMSLEDEITITGKYGFRCSQDIATGAAGAIAALIGIRKANWGYWIPVLGFEDIFKF